MPAKQNKRDKLGRYIKGVHFSSQTEFKNGMPSPRKGKRKPGWINKTSFKSRRSLWETDVREYRRIHVWIKKVAGQPNYCEICKKSDSKIYHWANVSHKYLEIRDDWIRLCPSCHLIFDRYELKIRDIADAILTAHFKKGIILIAGNGGSSEMASHFASELVGKFEKNREAIGAISLAANTAVITSIGNDMGFRYIFSRQLEAFDNRDNVLVCITTSDFNRKSEHSMNLFEASKQAYKMKMKQIIIGSSETKELSKCFSPNLCLKVRGYDVSTFQENQLKAIHLICRKIESKLK